MLVNKHSLMSIHVYWGQLFLIHKGVLKEAKNICRCFLWYGKHDDSKVGVVAWEGLCPKAAGGMAFRNTCY